MKTNYFPSKKISIYSLFGLITMVVASCGSTQNYQENDGIYGGSAKKEVATSDNKYKEYFSALNKENEEVFTDVENYSTQNDSVSNAAEANDNNGWGATPSTTTVIVYDNYWGNNYWGWNSWYGPSWGWGWNNWYGPNYGWGWNNWYGSSWGWGWNYPYYGGYYPYYGNYYGYNNGYYGYAYSNGRRDTRSYYNGGGIRTNRYNTSNRGITSRGNTPTVTPTRYNTAANSRNNTGASRDNSNAANPRPRANTTAPSRSYSNPYNVGTRSNTVTSPSRTNTNTVPSTDNTNTAPSRNNTYTPAPATSPSRDYSPSRSNDSRSYSPPSSSGGGRSGGSSGGGGGRSGGGGGGRR